MYEIPAHAQLTNPSENGNYSLGDALQLVVPVKRTGKQISYLESRSVDISPMLIFSETGGIMDLRLAIAGPKSPVRETKLALQPGLRCVEGATIRGQLFVEKNQLEYLKAYIKRDLWCAFEDNLPGVIYRRLKALLTPRRTEATFCTRALPDLSIWVHL